MSRYVVQYSFEAQEEGELSVNAGDTVTIIQTGDDSKDGWVFALSGGKTGYIPRDYVQAVQEPHTLGSADAFDTRSLTLPIQTLENQAVGELDSPAIDAHEAGPALSDILTKIPQEEAQTPSTATQAATNQNPTLPSAASHRATNIGGNSIHGTPAADPSRHFVPVVPIGLPSLALDNTPSQSLTLTGIESMAIAAASFDFDKMFESHDRYLARFQKTHNEKLQQLDSSLSNNAQKIEECLGHNEMLAERLSTLQLVIEHEHQRWSEKLTLERNESQDSDHKT